MSPQGRVYLGNAFSLQMLPETTTPIIIKVKRVSIEEVKSLLSNNNYISAIGHESTAKLLSRILSMNIPANRISIKLSEKDKLIVFQLQAGRLPLNTELTEEQLNEIVKNQLYAFYLVEIVNAQ